MQTDYAKAMAEFGLERGLEGSKAKHTTIAHFYESINRGAKIKLEPIRVEVPPLMPFGSKRAEWAIAQTRALKSDLAAPINKIRYQAGLTKEKAAQNEQLKRSNSALSLENEELKRKQKKSPRSCVRCRWNK